MTTARTNPGAPKGFSPQAKGDAMNCPACSAPESDSTTTEVRGIVVCGGCGARYTVERVYLGDSYRIVKPQWADRCSSRAVYFDFDVLGSGGVGRRHGWFDPTTGLITQTG